MRMPLLLLLILWLQGCGTVTTLSSSDQQITSQLAKQNTYCESVPRVYSGVAYDLCKLNSRPSSTQIDLLVAFYLFDGALCAVTDTLLLPYTIAQQSEKGSIRMVPVGLR